MTYRHFIQLGQYTDLVYVNWSKIIFMQPYCDGEGEHTLLYFGHTDDDKAFFVNETSKQILNIIQVAKHPEHHEGWD